MIEVICDGPESTSRSCPQRREDLLLLLGELGLAHQRVERRSEAAIALCFAPLRGAFVEQMSAAHRRLTVLVDEEGRSYAQQAEEIRTSNGLLGLVEASAWTNWKRGLCVAWGVYGEREVATRAGLDSVPGVGLQPTDVRLPIPETLARFLRASEVRELQGG